MSETEASSAKAPARGGLQTTVDKFIGGKVEAVQPKHGRHRSGLDAVMLAAAVPSSTRGQVIDLGAGVGVAGFCVAARLPDVDVLLVDNDPIATGLARQGLALPANAHFAGRIAIAGVDVTAPEPARVAAGLHRAGADHVIMNPPFNDPAKVRVSPSAPRMAAHVLSDEGLDQWLRAAASALREGGGLTVIWPAPRLAGLLGAMESRFGAVSVFPLHPYAGEPAIRVLVQGVKGSKAGLSLLPGLVLHEPDGAFREAAVAILRHGGGLDIGPSRR